MTPPSFQALLQGLSQQLKDHFANQSGLFDTFNVFKILPNREHLRTPSSCNQKGLLLHFPYPFSGLSFVREWSNNTNVSSWRTLADSHVASNNGNNKGASESNKTVHISKERDDVVVSATDRGALDSHALGNFSSANMMTEREDPRSVADHQGNQSLDPNYVRSSIELQLLQKQLDKMDLASAPASKETVGRATWIFLHTLAAQFPEKPTRQQQKDVKELMAILSRLYPCKECADHFKEVLKTNPVHASSGFELAQWMCRVHNVVNRSLGKGIFPCQRVDARWGALDCDEGGCDLQGRMH